MHTKCLTNQWYKVTEMTQFFLLRHRSYVKRMIKVYEHFLFNRKNAVLKTQNVNLSWYKLRLSYNFIQFLFKLILFNFIKFILL